MKSCVVATPVFSRAFRRLTNGGKLVCAALLLLAGQAAWAQSSTEDAPVTRKMLEDKIEEVRIGGGLDEAKKAELIGQLETALIRVGWAKDHLDNAAGFQRAIETSPADVERFNKQLEEAQSEQADTANLLAPNATIDEIGNRLSIEQAKRAALIERRNSIQKGIDGAPARANAIEARMVELRGQRKRCQRLGGDSRPADRVVVVTIP